MGINYVPFPFACKCQRTPVPNNSTQVTVDVHGIQLMLKIRVHRFCRLDPQYPQFMDFVFYSHFDLLPALVSPLNFSRKSYQFLKHKTCLTPGMTEKMIGS